MNEHGLFHDFGNMKMYQIHISAMTTEIISWMVSRLQILGFRYSIYIYWVSLRACLWLPPFTISSMSWLLKVRFVTVVESGCIIRVSSWSTSLSAKLLHQRWEDFPARNQWGSLPRGVPGSCRSRSLHQNLLLVVLHGSKPDGEIEHSVSKSWWLASRRATSQGPKFIIYEQPHWGDTEPANMKILSCIGCPCKTRCSNADNKQTAHDYLDSLSLFLSWFDQGFLHSQMSLVDTKRIYWSC